MSEKILLVDSSPVTISLNTKLFEKEGFKVFSTNTGAEALSVAAGEMPDCVITDALLPDMDGYELARRVRQECGAPVIFLTSCSEPNDISRALSAGDDFMLKPYSFLELSVRVKNLIRRQERTADILDFGRLVIHTDSHSAAVNGRALPLTGREFEILLTLASRAGTHVSTDELYRLVWNDETAFTPHVVMVNMSTLKKKLDRATGGLVYIKNERGKGYIFLDPPEEKGL